MRFKPSGFILAGSLVLAAPLGALPSLASATTTEEIQRIGLAPLYGALFAVSNCPDLTIDAPNFSKAARHYRLTAQDLSSSGPFTAEISDLSRVLTIRLLDDRAAFCSASRLQLAVPPSGILSYR